MCRSLKYHPRTNTIYSACTGQNVNGYATYLFLYSTQRRHIGVCDMRYASHSSPYYHTPTQPSLSLYSGRSTARSVPFQGEMFPGVGAHRPQILTDGRQLWRCRYSKMSHRSYPILHCMTSPLDHCIGFRRLGDAIQILERNKVIINA